MRQLRTGVTLKKAEDRIYTPHEKVYELAPYEVLMEDIRCKRYNLRKVSFCRLCISLVNHSHKKLFSQKSKTVQALVCRITEI